MMPKEVEDWNRYYRNSFLPVLRLKSGDRDVISVDKLTVNRHMQLILIGDSLEGGDSVDFREIKILPIPRSRVFSFNGIATVFWHRTDRQWCKGISRRNSLMTTPLADMLQYVVSSKGGVSQKIIPYSLTSVANLVFAEDTTYAVAERKLIHGHQLSAVVDKFYHVSLHPENNKLLLWRMQIPVAEITPQKNRARVLHPLFKQEVRDFFNRQGVYYGLE